LIILYLIFALVVKDFRKVSILAGPNCVKSYGQYYTIRAVQNLTIVLIGGCCARSVCVSVKLHAFMVPDGCITSQEQQQHNQQVQAAATSVTAFLACLF
jgi:hypothetical protein